MRRKLFEVQEITYTVSGKVVLGAKTEKDYLDFKENDLIVLVKPDGTEIETKIDSAELFKRTKPSIEAVLLNDFKREDVSIGTVIFKIE